MDHIVELECDFRVFFRLDDIHTLPSVRFLNYAQHCVAYHGAMRREFTLQIADEIAEARQEAIVHGQASRLAEAGGEVQTVPIQDSYVFEMQHREREEVSGYGGR